MELTIHYKGKLRNATELESLINEVKEIAVSNSWDYFIFEDAFKR
jgi:hypothetical protein